MTLRVRIAAVAGLAVALTVVAAAGFVYVAVRAELIEQVDEALLERSREYVKAPAGGPRPGGPFRKSYRHGPEEYGGAVGYVQFVTPSGTSSALPGTAALVPVSDAARAIARTGEGRRFDSLHVSGTHLRVLTIARRYGGAVQVARPLDEVDASMSRVLVMLILMGAAGVALAIALGTAVARAALAPIARFTERTEQLTGAPALEERIAVESDDELGRLAKSFNTAIDALQASLEAQRQLVADAGHELRTPLASLRANVQILQEADRLPAAERQALRDDIVSELDELTALVGDVVELARGTKNGGETDDVRVDLVLQAVAERTRRRAGDAIDLRVDAEETVVVGEPERIGRAISNLLDNARKWSPAGGTVEVTLRDGVLTVRDHGPGFAPADLPRVFERFYRSDRARAMPGSGLGLAIVRQAAEAGGGWADAHNAEGGGALLRVSFGPVVRER